MTPGEQDHGHEIGQRLDRLDRHLADSRQRDALEADRHGIEQAEQEAGAERRPGAPLGEDQGGERDEALARGHVGQEARRLADREIGAGQPAQHAGDDDRGVAQAGDGNAGGVDRGRVLADGAQAQAEAGVGRARTR